LVPKWITGVKCLIHWIFRSVKHCLLFPFRKKVICNVWHTMSFWSINRELSVKSLGCLTSFETLFTFKRQVKRWSLVWILICHSIVEAHTSFDFLSSCNSGSNRVDGSSNIFFSANSSGVSVIYKTVTLLRGMQVRRSNTWIEFNSFVIWLIGIFIYIVSFVQRERGFSFSPSFLHLLLIWLDIITGINYRPSNTGVFWRQVRVFLISETFFVEGISWSIVSLLSSYCPSLVSCHELLLEHRCGVSSLRSVSVDENVAHI